MNEELIWMRCLNLLFYLSGMILLLVGNTLFERLLLGGICLFAGFMSSIFYYCAKQIQGADQQ